MCWRILIFLTFPGQNEQTDLISHRLRADQHCNTLQLPTLWAIRWHRLIQEPRSQKKGPISMFFVREAETIQNQTGRWCIRELVSWEAVKSQQFPGESLTRSTEQIRFDICVRFFEAVSCAASRPGRFQVLQQAGLLWPSFTDKFQTYPRKRRTRGRSLVSAHKLGLSMPESNLALLGPRSQCCMSFILVI